MNRRVRTKNVEDLLFFDIETVSRNPEPIIDTKEYDLYAWFIRDKETNKIPEHDVIVDSYKRNAALKPEFNKIVCISVGFVKGDTIYYKAITGNQKEIIEEFYSIVSETGKLLAGHNIIGFDLPVIRLKAFECGVQSSLPETLNDSGAKPWTIAENLFDTMDITKGTYFNNISLDSMCMLAGVDTPKDDISGSQVTETFYKGEIERIAAYCNKDVIASIELFLALQGKRGVIKEYVERGAKIENSPLITAIGMAKQVSDKHRDRLLEVAKVLKTNEKERLVDIVKACLAKTKFEKEEEELFSELLK
jgi:predicted PolB exonuclease-like 3'-5' exonuclease